jgi:hypothetical protein
VYAVVTVVLGRDVLAQLSTSVANDLGDPLLTASILHWNAFHIPWSDAWWQFPIFYPTRDTLAFSEHLLGLSLIASPLAWITGSPLATYNLTMLLTFPLTALAMCALVYRLTGHAAAAFLAGLAFGFSPYRISTLPHIQMLASFGAPLALLGLHAYVDTGRRRWLVLYGAAWVIQAASNGYALVFLSLLVGMWVLWFVVMRRQWRVLGWIAAATVIAALPLAPILYQYVTVHASHGFERSIEEMRMYSADLTAVLCAPAGLTFWGWIRVACRGEGELFPGVALSALVAAALYAAVRSRAVSRPVVLARRVLLGVALGYGLVVASVLLFGPWDVDVAFIHASASGVDKPLLAAFTTAIAGLLIALGAHAASRAPATSSFYLFAALTMWVLTLGPMVTVVGNPTGWSGPFLLVPGASGLRVPARFWLMAVMCFAIAAGVFLAEVLKGRRRQTVGIAVVIAAVALLGDGWTARIPVEPAPAPPPNSAVLEGGVVLQFPIDLFPDAAATWQAVTGGWRSVNGYSGYAPNYYQALRLGARIGDEASVLPFLRRHGLHVLVREEGAEWKAMIERQPGVVLTGRRERMTQYWLPQRHGSALPAPGRPLRIESVRSECGTADVALMTDGDERTKWECLTDPSSHPLTIDLGDVARVGSLVHSLGPYSSNPPTRLLVETSPDGVAWSTAPPGSVLAEFIEAGVDTPGPLRAVLRFPPREARYVRLSPIDQAEDFGWFVSELEIRAP